MSHENPWLHIPATNLTGKAQAGKRVKVSYQVSQVYNGGIVKDGEWFTGYVVPPPVVPAGFKLVWDGCGLELNASPPLCYALLIPDA